MRLKLLAAVFLCVFVLSGYACQQTEPKAVSMEESPWQFKVIQKDRVLYLEVPARYLADGLEVLAADYFILNTVPLSREINHGSATTALLVYVQPKPPDMRSFVIPK